MAENKNANVSSEEVKIEKRFCTNCGKELDGNEVCICSKNTTTTLNADDVIKFLKEFGNTVINSFKSPASTLIEKVKENNIKKALIMLLVVSLTYGLYMTIGFSFIVPIFNGIINMNINSYGEIPYIKFFLYMSFINFVISFVPIIVTFLGAKIVGKSDFDFKKSISLYAYSNAPLVFTNLLIALLYSLNILSWLGSLIAIVVSLACFINYILSFLNIVKVNENKKVYLTTGIVIAWIFISIILAGSLISDFSNELSINENNNYGSLDNSFHW